MATKTERALFWKRFREVKQFDEPHEDAVISVPWLCGQHKNLSPAPSLDAGYEILPFRDPEFSLTEVPLDILAYLVKLEGFFWRWRWHDSDEARSTPGMRYEIYILGTAMVRYLDCERLKSSEKDPLAELRWLHLAGVDFTRVHTSARVFFGGGATRKCTNETLLEMVFRSPGLYLPIAERLARELHVDFSRVCDPVSGVCVVERLFSETFVWLHSGDSADRRSEHQLRLLKFLLGDGTHNHNKHTHNYQSVYELIYGRRRFCLQGRDLEAFQVVLATPGYNPFEIHNKQKKRKKSFMAFLLDKIPLYYADFSPEGVRHLLDLLDLFTSAEQYKPYWGEVAVMSASRRSVSLAEMAMRVCLEHPDFPKSTRLMQRLLGALSPAEINAHWPRGTTPCDMRMRKYTNESFLTVVTERAASNRKAATWDLVRRRTHFTAMTLLEHGYDVTEEEYKRVCEDASSSNAVNMTYYALLALLDKWRLGQLRVPLPWSVERVLWVAHTKEDTANPFRRLPRDLLRLLTRHYLRRSGNLDALAWAEKHRTPKGGEEEPAQRKKKKKIFIST